MTAAVSTDVSAGLSTTVMFRDTVRPKFLAGRTAQLVAINGQLARVLMPDEPAYDALRGRHLDLPLDVLAAWDAPG